MGWICTVCETENKYNASKCDVCDAVRVNTATRESVGDRKFPPVSIAAFIIIAVSILIFIAVLINDLSNDSESHDSCDMENTFYVKALGLNLRASPGSKNTTVIAIMKMNEQVCHIDGKIEYVDKKGKPRPWVFISYYENKGWASMCELKSTTAKVDFSQCN